MAERAFGGADSNRSGQVERRLCNSSMWSRCMRWRITWAGLSIRVSTARVSSFLHFWLGFDINFRNVPCDSFCPSVSFLLQFQTVAATDLAWHHDLHCATLSHDSASEAEFRCVIACIFNWLSSIWFWANITTCEWRVAVILFSDCSAHFICLVQLLVLRSSVNNALNQDFEEHYVGCFFYSIFVVARVWLQRRVVWPKSGFEQWSKKIRSRCC